VNDTCRNTRTWSVNDVDPWVLCLPSALLSLLTHADDILVGSARHYVRLQLLIIASQ